MKSRLRLRALGLLSAGLIVPALSLSKEPVRLFVKQVPLTVLGKEVQVTAIEQADGTPGYSPEQADGFHVEVVNQLSVPTTLHWHGLILPNAMDGVPFVTQEPIPPGGTFRYDFPLKQSGTYWMHSHYGLQEQLDNSAPLIIWTPEERAKADKQAVVMLSDFSFTPPGKILQDLLGKTSAKISTETNPPQEMSMAMPAKKAEPMAMSDAAYVEAVAQTWNDEEEKFTRTTIRSAPVDIDVKYDALLANRRTLDDPEIVRVTAGESVLLRIIAASSATNYYVHTGSLEATILAVDGKAIEPLRGDFFQLGIAQRIDLLVKIPKEGGTFPILAQGEGTRLLAGIVLATEGAAIPPYSREAPLMAAKLDNTQEKKLRASAPPAGKPADRTLPCALGGNMTAYSWTINGAAYPNRNALEVKNGERAEIVFTNDTMMPHPMHLHGHDFQVVEIDGEKISGALRDTLVVPPRSHLTIAFDANNPGLWAFHCHLLYHMVAGMFTVLKYEGADTPYWQPEKSLTELQKP